MTSLPEGEVPNASTSPRTGWSSRMAWAAGEAASRLAISTLAHLAIYFGKWHVRVDEPIADEMMDRAQRFYRSIDSLLLEASHYSPRAWRRR